MILCTHCKKEVIQDGKGYEVRISRWTLNFPKLTDYFHYHEDCWSEKFKATYISLPSSMDDLFGQFIEPE